MDDIAVKAIVESYEVIILLLFAYQFFIGMFAEDYIECERWLRRMK